MNEARGKLVKRGLAHGYTIQPDKRYPHDIVCSSNHYEPLGQPGCGCLRRLRKELIDAESLHGTLKIGLTNYKE